MPFEHILYDTDQGVAKITLNRPDVLNSLNRGDGGRGAAGAFGRRAPMRTCARS